MSHKIIVYTDGSALGNPGKAGFGFLIINKHNGTVSEYGGHQEHATNNQMEMLALCGALEKLSEITNPENVVIHIDSEYVKNGITKWIINWKKNGWMTAAKKPVLNKDIWIQIETAYEKAKKIHNIDLKYVPGHMGIAGNETVDQIARTMAETGKWNFFHGQIAEFERIRGVKL